MVHYVSIIKAIFYYIANKTALKYIPHFQDVGLLAVLLILDILM